MKRVVEDKPVGTIRADEVKAEMLVVAKIDGELYKLASEANPGQLVFWSDLDNGLYNYGGHFESVQDAIEEATKDRGEVFVLSDLNELADWIKENAG